MKPPIKSVVEEFGYDGSKTDILCCVTDLNIHHKRLLKSLPCFAEFAYRPIHLTDHVLPENVINLKIVQNIDNNPRNIDDFELEKASLGTELACLFCGVIVADVSKIHVGDHNKKKCICFRLPVSLPVRPDPRFIYHMNVLNKRDYAMKDLSQMFFRSRQFPSVLTHHYSVDFPIPENLMRCVI